MKKSTFLTALFLALTTFSAFAQNMTHRHTLSGSVGMNVFQIVGRLDQNFNEDEAVNFKSNATPSFGLQYDYAVRKWFSIGFSGSFNTFGSSADQITVTDEETGEVYTGSYDLNLSRTNLTVRPLFHYGNSGRIDMYSGLRVGASIWSANVKADGELDAEDLFGSVRGTGAIPAVQIILFGLRGYVTENIGIGFELGIGAPHYAALQANYRF